MRSELIRNARLKQDPYRKRDGGGGVVLDDPESDEGEELDEGEHVDAPEGDVLEEDVVGLVLVRDEEEEDALEELGGDSIDILVLSQIWGPGNFK